MRSIDRNTTLCLACSSSLPPRSSSRPLELFTTNCCNRPICPKCLSSNPRLARYDPCLACLAGVQVVQANNSSQKNGSRLPGLSADGAGKGSMNVDGSIRDQDLFVLGDEDDDDDDATDLADSEDKENGGSYQGAASTQEEHPSPSTLNSGARAAGPGSGPDPEPDPGSATSPPESAAQQQLKYYIKRDDTLLGIALRFEIDKYELCRLNNLPRSTVHTTPHLLHTRTYLILPQSVGPQQQSPLTANESQPVGPSSSRAAERAEKRLQVVTKEVDWRIAKAYVALAEDGAGDNSVKKEDLDTNVKAKFNEGGGPLEMQAIDQYLDDAEWEEGERRQGRGVSIQPFPYSSFGSKDSSLSLLRVRGFKWPWAN